MSTPAHDPRPSRPRPAGRSFAASVRPAILALRAAVADLLRERGLTLESTPTQIARKLGIDTKLGWKLANLVAREDPFEAGQYVPGMAAIELVLEAARKKRVRAPLRRAVEMAAQDYAQLVALHGGKRSSFDMLLAGQTTQGKLRFDLEHRKNAFEANGYLLGVQAFLQHKSFVLWPSETEGLLDAAVLTSFVDLRRLRPEVPWRLRRTYSVDDQGTVALDTTRESLDEALAAHGTLAASALECSVSAGGQVEMRLGAGPVGRTAASTLHTGEILRAVEPRYRTATFRQNVLHARLQTPVEHFVFDVLVHEALFPQARARASLYSDIFSDRTLTRPPECDRLELFEELQELGCDPESIELIEAPRYAERLALVLERADAALARFQGYRLRMRHPPTPTVLFVEHDLPPALAS